MIKVTLNDGYTKCIPGNLFEFTESGLLLVTNQEESGNPDRKAIFATGTWVSAEHCNCDDMPDDVKDALSRPLISNVEISRESLCKLIGNCCGKQTACDYHAEG
jgi:hypothetical protein